MVDFDDMNQRLLGLIDKLDEIENLKNSVERDRALKEFSDIMMSIDHDLTSNFIDEMLRGRTLNKNR